MQANTCIRKIQKDNLKRGDVSLIYSQLTTPAVIVDLDIAESNIARMALCLQSNGIQHRPHIKTHKSLFFAKKQMTAGACGITVAKISEAEIFAAGGFEQILIAYPIIGEDKLRRFAILHRTIELIATVDSMMAASGLSRVGVENGKPVRVLIEIDGGLHRTGRQPGTDIIDFAKLVKELPGLEIFGILGYFGTIYDNTTEEGFNKAAQHEAKIMKMTGEQLKNEGIQVAVVSSGSTPSAILAEHLEGITEVRAGNYIFFDVSAMGMGFAKEDNCALRVIVTVISTPLPGRATIDAGSKTLTSDKARHRDGYGYVVGQPEISITALNEEHGFLEFDPLVVSFKVGDRLEIIPNHSCVIPNLTNIMFGVRKGEVMEQITVDARGCNY
jgi:D-serine deaminase-like pyridoxal phosphate-dependent protein